MTARGHQSGRARRARNPADSFAGEQTEREALVAGGLRPFQGLCEVLAGQLGEVVEETESAATVLIEQMLRIDTAAESVATGVGDLASATDRRLVDARRLSGETTDQLQGLIDFVIQFVTTRDAAVLGLAKDVEALRSHAASIQKIAKMTNILALNAKIESIKAGDAGKGFRVVADEVGALSKASDVAAGQIDEGIDELAARLRSALGQSNSGDTSTAVSNLAARLKSVVDDNQAVHAIFDDALNRLHDSTAEVDQTARGLTELTTKVLGAVQFQDITRQMIEHVQVALARLGDQGDALSGYLGGDGDHSAFPDDTLASLSDSYVMERQRRVHARVTGTGDAATGSPGGQEETAPALELF